MVLFVGTLKTTNEIFLQKTTEFFLVVLLYIFVTVKTKNINNYEGIIKIL